MSRSTRAAVTLLSAALLSSLGCSSARRVCEVPLQVATAADAVSLAGDVVPLAAEALSLAHDAGALAAATQDVAGLFEAMGGLDTPAQIATLDGWLGGGGPLDPLFAALELARDPSLSGWIALAIKLKARKSHLPMLLQAARLTQDPRARAILGETLQRLQPTGRFGRSALRPLIYTPPGAR